MNKTYYIEEISQDIKLLELSKLKELANYVKFLKFREQLDPTLELLSNDNFYQKIKQGISEKEKGEIVSWESIQ